MNFKAGSGSIAARLATAATIFTLSSGFQAAAQPTEAQAKILPSPCRDFDQGAAKDHRRCFQVDLPEDPARPSGRHIQLDGFVIAAQVPNPEHAALFVLDGGPGQRATDNMTGEGDWSEVLTDRDIVVIDQRGTGTTPDIRCNGPTDNAHLQALLIHTWSAESHRLCLAKIAEQADVRLYTTANSVEDIELERRALGYARIDLMGTSWGGRLAQAYVQRHGAAVRSLTLRSPASPTVLGPAGRARRTEETFQAVISLCRADAACAKAYPNLREDFEMAKRRLWAYGLTTTDAAGRRLHVSPGVVATALRAESYNADSAARLPQQIHALARGDRDGAVARFAVAWRKGLETNASIGLYLAITCTEELPKGDLAALRRDENGTFMGHFITDEIVAACAFWPKGVDDPTLDRLKVWNGPVLVISGALDPAVPDARGLMGQFPNGRIIRLAQESHGLSDPAWTCLQPVIVAFIRTAQAGPLDTSCVESLRFPKFVVAAKGG
jgi:pimeloyl-ACP methyl ester carboxylesterase